MSRKAQVLIYLCCSSLPKWPLGLLTIFGEGGEEGDLRKCFFLPNLGSKVFFFGGPSTNKNNKTKSVSQFSVTLFCSLVTSFGSNTHTHTHIYIYIEAFFPFRINEFSCFTLGDILNSSDFRHRMIFFQVWCRVSGHICPGVLEISGLRDGRNEFCRDGSDGMGCISDLW